MALFVTKRDISIERFNAMRVCTPEYKCDVAVLAGMMFKHLDENYVACPFQGKLDSILKCSKWLDALFRIGRGHIVDSGRFTLPNLVSISLAKKQKHQTLYATAHRFRKNVSRIPVGRQVVVNKEYLRYKVIGKLKWADLEADNSAGEAPSCATSTSQFSATSIFADDADDDLQ